MKNKWIKILAGVLLIGSFPSCNDMLEEVPYGQLTTEQFLQDDPNNFDLIVGQVYANVKWLHDHWTYWGLNTLTTDEAICPVRQPSSHWADGNFWRELNTHNWTPEGKAFKYVWEYCNSGAVLCNKTLAQLETYKDLFDKETYDKYYAELVVVRSFYYYTLFDCFGKIPYSESYSPDFVPQSSPAEVWERLVIALEENAPKMPLATEPSKAYNYARATQGMAYTLLARLYLNAESYDVPADKLAQYDVYNKCVDACDKVIDSDVYHISTDYFSNFAIQNGNSEENIFVIDEDGSKNNASSGIDFNPMNKLRITLLTLHYNHEQIWKMQIKPWNGFLGTTELLSKYDPNDVRGLGSEDHVTGGTRDANRRGWFVGPVYNEDNTAIAFDENNDRVIISPTLHGYDDEYKFSYSSTKALVQDDVDLLNAKFSPSPLLNVGDKLSAVQATTYNAALNLEYENERLYTKEATVDNVSWNSGARCIKYEVDKTGTYMYCENDFVIFRYADVLYMKAEAILRGADGNLGELLALSDFQLMRTRVGLDPYTTGTLTLDEIYDERGREFVQEMVRRRDMIRFGTFTTETWGFVSNHGAYLKWFPIYYEVLTTEPRWEQNTGYGN